MNKIIIAVSVVIVLIGAVYWLGNNKNEDNEVTQKDESTVSLMGEAISVMGRNHINIGDEHEPYNSNPPTSGPHVAAVPWGFSDTELVDENVVHNLEHGGIWISYKDLDEESIQTLQDIARDNAQSVLVSPRAANDSRIAVASWGRLLKLDEVDREKINEFIATNINNSPERLAR